MDDDAPPGVPEWVVTYGDMMSLLLTFFIMLVSLSEVQADQKYRAVLEALQRHLGYRSAPVSAPGKHFPLNSMVRKLDTLGSFTNEDDGRGGIRVPSVAGEELRVRRYREGRGISAGEPVPFVADSETFAAAAGPRLAEIVRRVRGLPNKIEIRGHCSPRAAADGTPVPYRELLDLCFRRARRVRERLLEAGVEEQRIRLVALADSEPRPRTGEARDEHDDRVEVELLDVLADEFVGPRVSE